MRDSAAKGARVKRIPRGAPVLPKEKHFAPPHALQPEQQPDLDLDCGPQIECTTGLGDVLELQSNELKLDLDRMPERGEEQQQADEDGHGCHHDWHLQAAYQLHRATEHTLHRAR